jgi:hypothetical protein
MIATTMTTHTQFPSGIKKLKTAIYIKKKKEIMLCIMKLTFRNGYESCTETDQINRYTSWTDGRRK